MVYGMVISYDVKMKVKYTVFCIWEFTYQYLVVMVHPYNIYIIPYMLSPE
jgi:hypothetical protein